ncbi:hypothetical protein KKF91_06700, partial [Myxococcota bacterium]|nr:hypothetical protein [Myxococcota bacterium]
GAGNQGGRGGSGGCGGGGGGGASFGVYRAEGAAPVLLGNSFTVGVAGLGGASCGDDGEDGLRGEVY